MSVSIQTVEFERREAFLSELDEGPPYTVHGVALGDDDVTVGQSGIKKLWPAEELEKAAKTLEGKNLVEDHVNSSRGVVGKVTKAGYKDGTGVIYEAELFDDDLAENVSNGLLEVSIRGHHIDVEEMEEDEETGALIVEGIKFQNLSIVPTGASPSNTLEMGETEELSVAELSSFTEELNGDGYDEEDYEWDYNDGNVVVSEQTTDGSHVVLDEVYWPHFDFVARIYWYDKESEDYSHRLGHKKLPAGRHENVRIDIDEGPELSDGEHVIQTHLHEQSNVYPEGAGDIGPHDVDENPVVENCRLNVERGDELDASTYSWKQPDYDGTTEGQWNKPTLSDFENAGVEDLQEIGTHFIAVQGDWPAENFGELKLPVVEPNGDLNLNALQAVRGGRGVQALEPSPSEDMVDEIFSMTANLANREFDKDWPSSVEEAQLEEDETDDDEPEFDAGDTVQWDDNHGIILALTEDEEEAEIDIYEDDDGTWRAIGEETTVPLDDLDEWDVDFDNIGPMESDEEEESLATTGDKVSWSSSGGTARGIVRDRKTEGCFNTEIDGDVEVCADDDDPVLLIEVVDETEDGFEASGTMVAHKESTVNDANFELSRFRPEDGQMVMWQANPSMFGKVVHVDTDKHIAMVQIMEHMGGEKVPSGFTVTAGYEDVVPMKSDREEMSETFDDYPQGASENAQMALDARDETNNPNDCGTEVGWRRANQLANNEPVSAEVVSRMAQFNRHRDNKDQGDDGREDCGWMMWKAWGGDEGVDWAISKLEQIEEENMYENNDYNESKSSTVSLFKRYSDETSGLATMSGFREWLEEDYEGGLDEVPEQFQFESEEDAEEVADEMGIEGAHEMDGVWVPGDSHDMFMEAMEEMDEEERAAYKDTSEKSYGDDDDEEDEDDDAEKSDHDDDEEDDDMDDDEEEYSGVSTGDIVEYDDDEYEVEDHYEGTNFVIEFDDTEVGPLPHHAVRPTDAEEGDMVEVHDPAFGLSEGDEGEVVEAIPDSRSVLIEHDDEMVWVAEDDVEVVEGEDDDEENEGKEHVVSEALKMMNQFVTGDGDADATVDEFAEWAGDDENVERAIELFTDEVDDASMESGIREMDQWGKEALEQSESDDDEEEAEEDVPLESLESTMEALDDFLDSDDTDEQSSVDDFVSWSDDGAVDETVMLFTEEDEMTPDSEVSELWNWLQDEIAAREEENFGRGEGEEQPITNPGIQDENKEQSPERYPDVSIITDLASADVSGSTSRRTSANEESAGPVSVLTGDDLQYGSDGESEMDSLTTQVTTNMTNIEEELSELDEPVAVEKSDLEELQNKADQFEDMNSSLEELRERTDILDSVDREQVEELAESDEPVVVESTRYEELTDEAQQVAGVYAEALAEAYDLFDAEELTDRYSIEELREKYEENIGDPSEELAASPRSGDPSEEELEEAAGTGSSEELSEEVASKQEELRQKITGGR